MMNNIMARLFVIAAIVTPCSAYFHPLALPRSRIIACRETSTEHSIVSPETIAHIKGELWRVEGERDAAALAKEQSALITKLLGPIEELKLTPGASSASEELNELLGPHLPLLLGRSFPAAARAALQAGAVTTVGAQQALLSLSEFVMGAQQEVADALSELQWRQMQKLRELCEVSRRSSRHVSQRTLNSTHLSLRVCLLRPRWRAAPSAASSWPRR